MLFRSNGYDGRYSFTKLSDTELTYTITTTPNSPAIGTMVLHKSIRIGGSASIAKAAQLYTTKASNKLWAYIILDGMTVSKARETPTDATITLARGEDHRITAIRSFTIVVITSIPDTSIAARAERDLMQDVERFLYKSVVSVQFPTNLTEQLLGALPIGNSFTEIPPEFIEGNTAVYTHQFNFEITSYVTGCDAVDPQFNVAFRTIDLKILNATKPIKTTDTIELDS